MRAVLPAVLLILAGVGRAQERQRRIGAVELFGTFGIDVALVRQKLTVHVGDRFEDSPQYDIELRQAVTEAVRAATGWPPTDIAAVCCDERGDQLIYIGLTTNAQGGYYYDPAPKGAARLSPEALALIERAQKALFAAVRAGRAGEEHSQGYALSTADADLKAAQLALRGYAAGREKDIRWVLRSSSDAKSRQGAAQLLGYSRQSKGQIEDLVAAGRDPDPVVRNNAIRALMVLTESSPKTAAKIPGLAFVGTLESGIWTDRNKAAALLMNISQARAPELLAALRKSKWPLTEMARWHERGHAMAARMLLGRAAGIDDATLAKFANSDQIDEILKAVRRLDGLAEPDSDLLFAAKEGDLARVQALLKDHADKNAKDKNGVTPLMEASIQAHADVVQALIDAGADVEAENPDGTNALMFAVIFGHDEVVKRLIAAHAKIDAKDRLGSNALYYAAMYGRAGRPVVEALLDAGSDVNAAGPFGSFTLQVAANRCDAWMVKALLAKGSRVGDHPGGKGYSPLMLAARHGCGDVADALLAAGADPTVKAADGLTPAEAAEREGHPGLAARLRRR